MTPISAEDKTIASLKTLITDLNTQITTLEARINSLSDKAHSAVKAKNRVAAVAALKSKKAAETTLTQRYDTLTQLEGVYGKIEQASDQVAVIRVMKASTGILRNLHAQVGGIEKVENVVEDLREQMGKVDEVSQVLEEAGRGEAAVDEDAIDEELEALERQDRLEKEEAEQARQKLADLDALEKHIVPADVPTPKHEPRENTAVAHDTQALRRLSLRDDLPNGDRANQKSRDLTQGVPD